MKHALYLFAALLVIAWAILFLGFNIAGITHLLLGVGIGIFVTRVLMGRNI